MKKNLNCINDNGKTPAFVTKAERAFRRAAKNLKKQNRALKLPLIVWKDGRVVEEPA